jgi:hypothetical protein
MLEERICMQAASQKGRRIDKRDWRRRQGRGGVLGRLENIVNK